MSVHDYLGVLWIAGAAALGVWGVASLVTYWTSETDRNRARVLVTLCLVTTALVIADIARLRWRWEPFGIRANPDAVWIAVYRTCWVGLLWHTTYALYWPRLRAWLGRRVRR